VASLRPGPALPFRTRITVIHSSIFHISSTKAALKQEEKFIFPFSYFLIINFPSKFSYFP